MKLETNSERVARLMREMTDRRVPSRTLPRGAQWTGLDIPGRGNAPKRRLAQMAKGQILRICESCQTNTVPKDRELRVCDACLEARWNAKPTKVIDTVQK